MRYLLPLGRVLVTCLALVGAAFGARSMWLRSQMQPWTRDGRVRADIVQVTPDVSGLVTQVMVHDNQFVRRGEVLFVLDRPRYAMALSQAEAAVAAQRAQLAQAQRENLRNHALGDLVPTESVEQGSAKVELLKATLAQALAARDVAALNLQRTTITASRDGVVADVEMQPGDYLTAGRQALALVFGGSTHVDGYFEETKLPAIQVGDRARVQLMGVADPVWGHVESIAGGVEDRERSASGDLLPNVNPTFSWVRLPQRIPVRVAVDKAPVGVRLTPGLTATVVIYPRPGQAVVRRSWPW